jgi:perosamine synthetase
MVTAISRYGTRVLQETTDIIRDQERKGQMIEGPFIAEFEQAFAARLGGVQAVSTSYGRMAFYYILKAMNFPAGSEIILPALTFWVIPEIAHVVGLTPVFADVDPTTFNMTAASFEAAITPRTVAVVPTHLWGLPCDMDEIVAVAGRHHIRVIEDCAHALGALYKGRSIGTLGDAALFSFQTIKPLNTYGGGMAVMRDPELAGRVRELAYAEPLSSVERIKKKLWHGQVQRIATRPKIFTWTMFPLVYFCSMMKWDFDGYFWETIRSLDPLPDDYRERYTNVQAALGLTGLKYLDQWTCATQKHAKQLSAVLSHVPGVRVPSVPADRTHAFYQYCAYVPARDTVVARCLKRGVDIESLHVDVCTDLDIFKPFASPSPGAKATTETIQIPVYEALNDAQVERVATVVRDVVISLNSQAAPAMGAS